MGYLSQNNFEKEYDRSTFSPETQSLAAGGSGGAGGAGGAGASGGAGGAAIGLAGSFLAQYLANRQRQFEQEKAARMQIAQNQAENESRGLGFLEKIYGNALR